MKLIIGVLLSALAFGASGEVSLTGTIIFAGTPPTGVEPAKAFDGDPLTSFSATNGWVGLDAGKAVTATHIRIMPRAGDGSGQQQSRSKWSGAVIEAANASTFSGSVTLYAVPDYDTGTPFYWPGKLWEVAVSPGAAYRYYRFRSTGVNYSPIAEFRVIVNADSGLSAQPVPPILTPGSGAALTGSEAITMASTTTSATIHYTTDGTTPDCSSTPYSAPFLATIGAATLIQAVACDAGLSTPGSEVSAQHYRNYGFAAGDTEYDTDGNQIEAYNGGLTYLGGTYYRVGNNYATVGTFPNGTYGLNLYSSTDLYRWRYESTILPNAGWVNLQRFHVIHNSSTGKYVTWGNVTNDFSTGSRAMIASADAPTGPWTIASSNYNPGSLGFKDNNLFVDDDGTGYVIFTNGAQDAIVIMQLASDYLTVTGSATTVVSGGREAPAMWKRGATYFIVSSGTDAPTNYTRDVQYQTASTPLGTWSGTHAFYSQAMTTQTGYNAQPTAVLKVPGYSDAYLYVGDAWAAASIAPANVTPWQNLNATTELYLPLSFPTSTSVVAPVLTDFQTNWDLSWFRRGSGQIGGSVRIGGSATIQ